MVVPYGDDVTSLNTVLGELPTGKVIALVPSDFDPKITGKVKSYLSSKGIDFEIRMVSGGSPDSYFLELSKAKAEVGDGNLIVNVSVGSPFYSHVLLLAAMATGVTALGVYDGELTFLPISCSITHGG
jgi:hypothetical protein